MNIYWLNNEETAIENGPHPWPTTLNRHGVCASNPTEEHVRLAHGRLIPEAPALDPATQYLGPVQLDAPGGELVVPVIDYTAEELAQIESDRIAAAVSMIWQAAHDYEFAQISGSAIGMLTVGVSQGLPKSSAVQVWLGTIWDLYYSRREDVNAGQVFDDNLIDFTSCGEIPHTIPELRAEIGF